MRPRDRGAIVQVGSALGYRGIPLQSAYCGAKHAIQGFTESLRCELLHDKSGVRVTMVVMPAVNTPQFDWVLSRLPRRAQPVPPIYEPEVAARTVVHAAENSFLACDFWLADALHGTCRTAEAERLFTTLLDLRNDVGLLSEEYDSARQRLVGNFPQAFSMVGLVNTARHLAGSTVLTG
jgi:NAD(P)-dependent dehydrogenase (short-subunit alcohol dehydrogenase family)